MIQLGFAKKVKEVKEEKYDFPYLTLRKRENSEDKKVYSTFELSKSTLDLLWLKDETDRHIEVANDGSTETIYLVKDDKGNQVGFTTNTFSNGKLYDKLVKLYNLNENIDNHFKLEVVENEEYNGFPVLKLVEIVSEAFDETEVLNNEVVEESDDFDTL